MEAFGKKEKSVIEVADDEKVEKKVARWPAGFTEQKNTGGESVNEMKTGE